MKKVFKHKNKPSALPIMSTIVVWLCLDRVQPDPIFWGIAGTLMVLVWIGAIYGMATETQVDIFEDKN